ncbi:YdeI/OmpD-associated family protein [Bailinhaonella thermotolerans]|uniref:YdeI/OmpD-associated family protein n=1 Tax=Bailinhaonella thermotolerans TaxID=1070861 RepID=UPI001F5B4447|nr:YdeI/OmpD-associated family protein [Bailinhaonella thermotolerans]
MEELNGLEILGFEKAAQWEEWLAANEENTAGVWVKIAKKGVPGVSRDEALDAALCHGWIDGQAKSYDERFYLQKFSQRRRRSVWSKVNVAKVAALTEAGRMRPRGLAEVEAAKADGRWDAAYDSPATAEVPPDLAAALEANDEARAFFETLSKSDRYIILLRLATALKPATREARLKRMIATLASGRKVT